MGKFRSLRPNIQPPQEILPKRRSRKSTPRSGWDDWQELDRPLPLVLMDEPINYRLADLEEDRDVERIVSRKRGKEGGQ